MIFNTNAELTKLTFSCKLDWKVNYSPIISKFSSENITSVLFLLGFGFTSHLAIHLSKTNKKCWHCWGSKDEISSDSFLWTPTQGHTSVGQPARTYVYQFSAETGCCLEDLPKEMDDRDRW